MKRLLMLFAALFLTAAAPSPATTNVAVKLSPSELEELAGPIALYPDPLLGIILPASVFPDQIVDAALLIKSKNDAPLISQQSWDDSVKSVATYPGVLKMMFEKIDWTAKLGNAFLNQSPDLRDAVQRLRGKAQSVGNLRTTEEQKVTTGNVNGQTVIQIQPATPEVVYVPQYSTQTVYTEPAPATTSALVPLATFGIGMALGAAMADDDDDDHYYYGGYPGGVSWYSNDSVDHWMDNRQDMIRDSQHHRQDVQNDRINYRQDMREDRQGFRQDQIESGNYPNKESRQEFQQQQSANRQERASSAQERASSAQANRDQARSSMSTTQKQNYDARKQQAQQRSQEWKGTAADRGYSRSSSSSTANAARANRSASGTSNVPNYGAHSSSGSRASSGSRSSAVSGYSSRSASSAYGSRGSSSRSAGGYSRSSGSMSRGGGGGRARSGGGGRRR